MKLDLLITDQPLHLAPVVVPGCGAVARFDGLVRGEEHGAPIAGLLYEAYPAMAERVMRTILTDLHASQPFDLARVHHRVGFVPVGEPAILMDVHARHRGPAFTVLRLFMDRLKQDVPIWKTGSRPA
jgi:molybdopterin synthase catalytic subunit